MPKTDFGDTLNLPKTDFSMKANLPQLEERMLRFWSENKIYEKICEARKNARKFILHDGPPYANGDVHIGTALNKILKDIFIKYKTMQGFNAPFVPGWDCHGLPVEHNIMVSLGEKYFHTPIIETRRLCREFAEKYVNIQKRQFQRLGVFGDWDNPYLTLSPSYEVAIIEVLEELWEKGFLYRKKKPIHWCINCSTALAEAELEYKTITSPSIYVRFTISSDLSHISKAIKDKPVEILIWTTTPWTLPANLAVAVHPDKNYAFVEYKQTIDTPPRIAITSAEVVDRLFNLFDVRYYKILKTFPGSELEKVIYKHVIYDKTGIIVLARYVKTDEATGSVHIAPGHGEEDYQTGLEYGLEPFSPVDEKGRFTEEAIHEWLVGQNVFDANLNICEKLKYSGALIYQEEFEHSYPTCWRCKKPVIFRAAEQWFINIDHKNARKKALDEIEKVKWIPQWGKSRIASMIKDRPDWCISRQRYWGVPIPAVKCTRCNYVFLDEHIFSTVKKLFEKEGSDIWYKIETKDILPDGFSCPKCQGQDFQKQNEILDVWFESASSHRVVLYKNPEIGFPADVYLEGHDQHRGWFQVSLWASLLSLGQAPYKTVITHGFVVDAKTRTKIAKSVFQIPADEICKNYGAELLRIWVTSAEYTNDMPFSLEVLEERKDVYRKIRNTFRYLLANLYDFDPKNDQVTLRKMRAIDKWALTKLQRLIEDVEKNYEQHELHKVFSRISSFCNVELSSLYFDIVKDRLYVLAKDSLGRRACQTVLYRTLMSLVKMLSPIMCFTTEEVWQNMKWEKEHPSVHLASWVKVEKRLIDDEIEKDFEKIWQIRSELYKEIERLREEGNVGSSVETGAELYLKDQELLQTIRKYEDELPEIMKMSLVSIKDSEPEGAIESQVIKGLFLKVYKLPYLKCERCWNYHESVGKNKTYPTLCSRCIKILKQIGFAS